MNKIIFSNNKTAWLITCSIFITGFIGIFIPFIFINYLPQSLFGLSRTLVSNMVLGVSEGFSKKLQIKRKYTYTLK